MTLAALYAVLFNAAVDAGAPGSSLPLPHHHHRFSGSPVGYAGLAAASVASWIGVPGPGEPLLITAGILASKNKLDISSVLLVAWVSATAGGVGGWLMGMNFGRRLLSIRGPLHTFRQGAISRGDEIFKRYGVVAIVLTPSWVAGIHHARAKLYLPINALAALTWAVAIGLGSYYLGPPVLDFVADLGWVTFTALVALIAAAVGLELVRRRRLRRQREASD